MRRSRKPVRKCHKCPLNMGLYCWAFPHPRDEWRAHIECRGRFDSRLHELFEVWKADTRVKTRRQLRQAVFRSGRSDPHLNHYIVGQNRRGQ